MSTLDIVRQVTQNALMRIPAVQQMAMRAHSTGMNDDEQALQATWAFYEAHVDVQGKRVLELGPGRSLQLLTRARAQGARHGTALDVVQYEDALQQAQAHGLDFRHYDGGAMPLESGSFDVIWSSDVFEHLREPALTVAECRRVLAPGGLCLARIDLRDHLFLHQQERWLDCLRYTDRLWRLMTSNRSTYVNRLRASDWRALFGERGFEIAAWTELRVDGATLAAYRQLPFLEGLSDDDLAIYRVDVVLRG